jgi:two-component system, NtrC family, response regulator AtoC
MLSGTYSTSLIVQAMKQGASDFVTKPISPEQLRSAVDKFLPVTRAQEDEEQSFPDISLQPSAWNRKLQPLLDRIANSDIPVLLQGETGVGKEILARKIHEQSRRTGKIFLKLNCAALPSELVESELFGYERGAFTGAFKNNPGKFELAAGGTFLLDEIGDMDLKLQAKLLQVLQDREFLRLGSREPTRVDIRVIAATHRDLESAIEQRCFREDLYHRLNVVTITIPPLRERQDEILGLARFFIHKYAEPGGVRDIGRKLQNELLSYSWPGNVRELENLMRKYVVLADSDEIIADLHGRSSKNGRRIQSVCQPTQKAFAQPQPTPPESEILVLAAKVGSEGQTPAENGVTEPGSTLDRFEEARRQAESQAILDALNTTLWNRKRAAALLGTDYKAFLYKMKKLGIGTD